MSVRRSKSFMAGNKQKLSNYLLLLLNYFSSSESQGIPIPSASFTVYSSFIWLIPDPFSLKSVSEFLLFSVGKNESFSVAGSLRVSTDS